MQPLLLYPRHQFLGAHQLHVGVQQTAHYQCTVKGLHNDPVDMLLMCHCEDRHETYQQAFLIFEEILEVDFLDAREEALIELKAIEQKYHSLKAELGQFADNDPATFEAMKEAIKVAYEAANRWTDNIFTMHQWWSNNFPQAKDSLNTSTMR